MIPPFLLILTSTLVYLFLAFPFLILPTSPCPQDDLFPPTRAAAAAGWLTSSEWLGGSTAQPPLVSLQPAGMSPLSTAPAEELTHRQKESLELKASMAAPAQLGHSGMKNQEEVLSHFQNLSTAGYVPKSSRWDAKRDEKNEVNEDEWD